MTATLTSCFSSSDTRVAADYRSGVTHCHEEHDPPWDRAPGIPNLPVPSVRSRP
jgi:hypothetical protein